MAFGNKYQLEDTKEYSTQCVYVSLYSSHINGKCIFAILKVLRNKNETVTTLEYALSCSSKLKHKDESNRPSSESFADFAV